MVSVWAGMPHSCLPCHNYATLLYGPPRQCASSLQVTYATQSNISSIFSFPSEAACINGSHCRVMFFSYHEPPHIHTLI